jgi:hypothetical protein
MGKNRPTTKRLYADRMAVTLENGHWVARFYQHGKVMWTVRSDKPAADAPTLVVGTPIRFSYDVPR